MSPGATDQLNVSTAIWRDADLGEGPPSGTATFEPRPAPDSGTMHPRRTTPFPEDAMRCPSIAVPCRRRVAAAADDRARRGRSWLAGIFLSFVWLATPVFSQAPFDILLNKLQATGYVTDTARVLDARQKSALTRLLTDLEQKTTAEIAVVTIPSLEGGEIRDFANRLFEKWGVGSKEKNNGVLFLVAVQDRKVQIEVGYGLERLIPDAKAGRILDENVVPFFRGGQMGAGIVNGTVAVAQIIAGDAGVPWSGAPQVRTPGSGNRRGNPFQLVGGFIFVVIFLIFFMRHPFLAMLLLSGGRHRHYGGGRHRGGFGGGGFGGGGFGGFGGGMSGGGGAGRSW